MRGVVEFTIRGEVVSSLWNDFKLALLNKPHEGDFWFNEEPGGNNTCVIVIYNQNCSFIKVKNFIDRCICNILDDNEYNVLSENNNRHCSFNYALAMLNRTESYFLNFK